MKKQKLELLPDKEFLQYMQFVWSCYEMLIPTNITNEKAFQNFTRHLTSIENMLIGKNHALLNENELDGLRLQLMNDLSELIIAAEGLDNIVHDTFLKEIEKALDIFDMDAK